MSEGGADDPDAQDGRRTSSPRYKVTHHSDHGSEYTSDPFREVCEEADVTLSMGSVVDCYENTMAERFFATQETELIDRQPVAASRAASRRGR